jgi:UDP-N-acetylglucosamine 1-carboxyvinyltransferase
MGPGSGGQAPSPLGKRGRDVRAMHRILIRGGRTLEGEVRISGAKNAALPLLAATLLSSGPHRLTNVPRLRDIDTFKSLLEQLGPEVEIRGDQVLVDAGKITSCRAPYELVKTMRASVLVLGPLLARTGRAMVSLPGGCAIGTRPIDQHLKGLEALGANITLRQGYVYARTKGLQGTSFCFDLPTVTGTENLMMAAALAQGRTVLRNTACEPEVLELAQALNDMGARIQGAGTDQITIDGVGQLGPMIHRVGADRIEAGTFMVAAAITRGEILLRECPISRMEAVVGKLRESGVQVSIKGDLVRVWARGRPEAVDVKTRPYPGFPTDMQAQIMALLALAKGTSVITETVFEDRFMHVAELRRMGAQIQLQGANAVVKGVARLKAAPVMATDLRASASLILAGLAAEGVTEISRVYHLDRGYERLEEKLSALGADICRVQG